MAGSRARHKAKAPSRLEVEIQKLPKITGTFRAAVRDGDGGLISSELKGRGVLLRVGAAGETKVVASPGLGPIYDLHVDGKQRWFCDNIASVVRWDGKAYARIALPIERAIGVTRDGRGQYWIAGFDDGDFFAVAVSTDGKKFAPLKLRECYCDVWPLAATRRGVLLPVCPEEGHDTLWLGAGKGVKPTALRGDFNVRAGAETAAGTLVVVTNTGQVHRSEDGGKRWRKLQVTPELDDLCAVATFGAGRVVVAGKGGFVAVSDDDGKSFAEVDHGFHKTDLTCAASWGDDGFVVAGTKGHVLIARPRT